MGLFSSSDIGVDLGTAYSLIYVRGKGIVLRQPSVVAVERGSGKMAALGEKAKEMLGRASDDQLVFRPMQDGVIANLDATERMLSAFFQEWWAAASSSSPGPSSPCPARPPKWRSGPSSRPARARAPGTRT